MSTILIFIQFSGHQVELNKNKTFFCLLSRSLKTNWVIKVNKILLYLNNTSIQVGTPFLKDEFILLQIKSIFKSKKILVHKVKRKNNYKKTQGTYNFITKVEPYHLVKTKMISLLSFYI